MFMALNVLFKFLLQAFEHVAVKRFAAVDIEEEAHHKEELQKRIKTLMSVIRKTIYVALWSVAVMIVLSQLGINIGPLVATAGVLGLAVSFGAQNLIKDFISGLFMILENQVRLGDVAIINGTGGLVEEINLRTIVLRDLSGVVHIFPNGSINTISNMTLGWSAYVFDIGVAYKEDTDRVSEIMYAVLESMRADPKYKSMILEPLEIFGVDDFADSAVVVKARVKTRPIKQWDVAREYRRRLKKAFDEQGIEIPFPHLSVYFGENSKAFRLLLEQAQK
ncbi:mechanosensitive ion channel family protein [candidate division FCPU426 bacterium]|nr:mechanosensitive ion channel family protein [candidate division FCPU426 bacterium]